MSPKGASKKLRRNQRPIILVFGEDSNDTRAIKILVDAISKKAGIEFDVDTRRDPPSLTRHALPAARGVWLERIASLVVSEISTGRSVRAVLVHQDSDGPDPNALVAEKLDQALAGVMPDVQANAVVPIQMTESWWLLFPSALRAYKPAAWREVKFASGINVETVSEPKKDLMRRTRASSPRHAYLENMSAGIAEKIVDLDFPKDGTSPSWDRFEAMARAL